MQTLTPEGLELDFSDPESLYFNLPVTDPQNIEVIDEPMLSHRWKSMVYFKPQYDFEWTDVRFNVVPAGRRTGKTEKAKYRFVRKAMTVPSGIDDPWLIVGAPTHTQAVRIYWLDLVRLTPKWMIKEIRVGEKIILLKNGARMQVVGLDVPERVEGIPIYHFLGDEWASTRPRIFPEHIRPSLADHRGTADLIGVPEGRGEYYELYKTAQRDQSGEWSAYHWTSEDVLPLYGRSEEIEAAKRDLDELTYQQEFLASFVSFSGRAYYKFNTDVHAKYRVPYDPEKELVLTLDFNVDPGTGGILQEFGPGDEICKKLKTTNATGIIDEIFIEFDSNTERVCRKFVSKYGHHKGPIRVFGDATGGARHTSGTSGTNWDIVRSVLYDHFGDGRVAIDVPPANPSQRKSINSVNSRIMSMNGEPHLAVDPVNAPRSIMDFEGVQVIPGGSGEIMKSSDSRLTHLSDGYRYYIHRRFPFSVGTGVTSGVAY